MKVNWMLQHNVLPSPSSWTRFLPENWAKQLNFDEIQYLLYTF